MTPGDQPLALWVVPVAEPGGVARHVLDVVRSGLPGYRLAVLCPEGPLAERLRELGAEVLAGGFGTEAGVLASVRTLARTLRERRPALVHSHLAYADVVAAAVVIPRRLAGNLLGGRLPGGTAPKLVTTEHGIAAEDSTYQSSRTRAKLVNAVHRARLAATDLKIAVSESTREQMRRKWRAQNVAVVPNRIDHGLLEEAYLRERVPAAEGETRYLSLSRLAPEKRIGLLVEAFARVAAEDPGARLHITGSGPDEAALKALVSSLGLQDSVTFVPFAEPARALGTADVVVQLSVWENWTYTLMDAAALGLPVVATDVGGNREVLAGDVLVLPEGREAQVAAVRDRMLQARSATGRRIDHGNVQDMIRDLTRLYTETLEHSTRR